MGRMMTCRKPGKSPLTSNWLRYCWWKKSCATLDVLEALQTIIMMVYSLPPLTGATSGLLNHQRYDPEIETLHGTGFLAFLKVLVSIFTPWEPSFAVSPRRQWQRNTAPLTVASRSARKAIRNVIKTRNLGQLSGYSPWRQGLQCEGWLEFIWRIVVLKHQVILSWHMAHVSHVKCS